MYKHKMFQNTDFMEHLKRIVVRIIYYVQTRIFSSEKELNNLLKFPKILSVGTYPRTDAWCGKPVMFKL